MDHVLLIKVTLIDLSFFYISYWVSVLSTELNKNIQLVIPLHFDSDQWIHSVNDTVIKILSYQ